MLQLLRSVTTKVAHVNMDGTGEFSRAFWFQRRGTRLWSSERIVRVDVDLFSV